MENLKNVCLQTGEGTYVVYSSVQIIWAFRAKTVHMQKSILSLANNLDFIKIPLI